MGYHRPLGLSPGNDSEGVFDAMRTTSNQTFTFDPKTNTYRIRHDWQDDEPVSTALIMGVAAVTNAPPTEIDPLYEVVDPDALNRLFEPTANSSLRPSDGRATFTMNGCTVTVYGSGDIEITPPSEPEE